MVAIINRSDRRLAPRFAINAVRCVAILAIAYSKRRRHAKRLQYRGRPAFCVAS